MNIWEDIAMMQAIDPILVTVIQRRLKATRRWAGRSPPARRFFPEMIVCWQGELLEQTAYIPILAFAVLFHKVYGQYFGDCGVISITIPSPAAADRRQSRPIFIRTTGRLFLHQRPPGRCGRAVSGLQPEPLK
jgi:hypothetical protein